MAGDHTATSNVNKDFLTADLNLHQYRNTTIFTKGSIFVLSPSISNENNWFDVRLVNIERFTDKYTIGHLLVRLRNKFLLMKLTEFLDEMTDDKVYSETKNSGIHWKYRIVEHQSLKTYTIVNMNTKQHVTLNEIDKGHIKDVFG